MGGLKLISTTTTTNSDNAEFFVFLMLGNKFVRDESVLISLPIEREIHTLISRINDYKNQHLKKTEYMTGVQVFSTYSYVHSYISFPYLFE